MIFIPQKAIKDQALADFFVAHLVPKLYCCMKISPDEVIEANMISNDEVWKMFFDGASKTGSKGKIFAGVWWCLSRHLTMFFNAPFH